MNEIVMNLERGLKESLVDITKLPQVVTISGLTGSGKTAIINEWLDEKGYKYKRIDCASRNLYEVDGRKYLFTPLEIDEMSTNQMIYFFDDYDYASYEVRKQILMFIRFNEMYDYRRREMEKLFINGNSLFRELEVYTMDEKNNILIIVTIHPENTSMAEPFDEIENMLFRRKID